MLHQVLVDNNKVKFCTSKAYLTHKCPIRGCLQSTSFHISKGKNLVMQTKASLWNCSTVANRGNVKIFGPLLLQANKNIFSCLDYHAIKINIRAWKRTTFTCWLGNAEVLRVSCVSSTGRLLGTLRTNAAWSHVAAVAVMRYPPSHLRWIPSLGYRKSSSTTYRMEKYQHKSHALITSDTIKRSSIILFRNLITKSSISGHDNTPSGSGSGHGSDVETFSPFLVYPLEWKRITDFVGLLSILGTWSRKHEHCKNLGG